LYPFILRLKLPELVHVWQVCSTCGSYIRSFTCSVAESFTVFESSILDTDCKSCLGKSGYNYRPLYVYNDRLNSCIHPDCLLVGCSLERVKYIYDERTFCSCDIWYCSVITTFETLPLLCGHCGKLMWPSSMGNYESALDFRFRHIQAAQIMYCRDRLMAEELPEHGAKNEHEPRRARDSKYPLKQLRLWSAQMSFSESTKKPVLDEEDGLNDIILGIKR
jgi:hypothetical protein